MGILDKFTSLFAPRKTKVRVICVGLDNSGKSTVINYLKPKKVRRRRAPAPANPARTSPCRDPAVSLRQSTSTEVVPTVGFSVEEFAKGNLGFTVFDMSGQVLPAMHTLTTLAPASTLTLARTLALPRGGTATCGSTTTRTAAASSSRLTRATRSGCAPRERRAFYP